MGKNKRVGMHLQMFLSKIIKFFILYRFHFNTKTFCLLKKKTNKYYEKKHLEVYSLYIMQCETKIETSLLDVYFFYVKFKTHTKTSPLLVYFCYVKCKTNLKRFPWSFFFFFCMSLSTVFFLFAILTGSLFEQRSHFGLLSVLAIKRLALSQ